MHSVSLLGLLLSLIMFYLRYFQGFKSVKNCYGDAGNALLETPNLKISWTSIPPRRSRTCADHNVHTCRTMNACRIVATSIKLLDSEAVPLDFIHQKEWNYLISWKFSIHVYFTILRFLYFAITKLEVFPNFFLYFDSL